MTIWRKEILDTYLSTEDKLVFLDKNVNWYIISVKQFAYA